MNFEALTPDRAGKRGELNYTSIGIPETTPEIAVADIPVRDGRGRRDFLRGALSLGVGAVLGSGEAQAKNYSEKEMDDEDNKVARLLSLAMSRPEATERSIDHERSQKPTQEEINKFIDLVVDRANKEGKGVHFQQHENVEWLIKYFKTTGFSDSRIYYIPAKTGANSLYVKVIMNNEKLKTSIKETKFDRRSLAINGVSTETTIYTMPDEIIKNIVGVNACEAVIDVGTAYVILPAGTPIIEKTDTVTKVKTWMLAECRNPIVRFMDTCPPAKKS